MSDRNVAEQLEEWAETIVGTGTSSIGHVQQRVNDLREAAALLREPSEGREPVAVVKVKGGVITDVKKIGPTPPDGHYALFSLEEAV